MNRDDRAPQQPAVDAGWLEACLGAPPGALESAQWSAVGTGQVAASFRGRLFWREQGFPDSVVIKCPSADPDSRASGLRFNLYEREIAWYSTLRERCQIRCAQYFGSQFDAQSGDFVLLLQDCAPAEQGDQLAGTGVERVRLGLAELAHLHAAFFRDPAIEAHPLTCRDPEMTALRIGLYAEFWPLFKERYTGRLAPELLAMGSELAARYERFERRETPQFSLVHGDFRLDNLLWHPAGGRPFVLDWQTMGVGCPMKDVAYFIGTSLADNALRCLHEDDLLAGYFSHLRDAVGDIDEEALRREYRVQALTGLVMAVFSSMLVERTERGDEMFALMAERPGRQALELDSVSLL